MTSTMRKLLGLTLLCGVVVLAGCRGTVSHKPPVHINPNMDFQERMDPQEATEFFADGRAMRQPVPGTVARGFLKDDAEFYFGRSSDGGYVTVNPVPITRPMLDRGQQKYNTFCAPCHGLAGDGQGPIMVGEFGFVPAPTYHREDLVAVTDGYLYEVVSNGVRTMAGYSSQISVADRWAIVAYVRALQKSQYAREGDIPDSERARIDAN